MDCYKNNLDRFRQQVIYKLIEYIYGDEYPSKDDVEYFTYDDISKFFELIAKNKIRADKEMQEQKPIIYFYKHITDAKNWNGNVNEVGAALVQEQIDRNPKMVLDYFDERIFFTKEFEALEKMNRKKSVDPKYHMAIDALDLTALKKNLIDPVSGSCFTPKGRQGEFLLNHNRFNFIAGSRRIGKTFL